MAGSICKIGFGSLRVSRHCKEHRDALVTALRLGVNLIDTSPNYGDGSAEELIGDVLRHSDLNETDNLTIVTKFGYIDGHNLLRYLNDNLRFPDTINCGKSQKYCIHPDFMRDQLSRSLDRLQVNCIDIYLIQNPEIFFFHSIPQLPLNDFTPQAEIDKPRAELLRRIGYVFEALEYEVRETGRLKSYGISSSSFSYETTHPHFLPYEGLVDLASAVASKVSGISGTPSGFKAVQFPANLVVTEGLRRCGKWAAANNLMVLITKPLTALSVHGSWRLAEYPIDDYDRFFDNTSDILKAVRSTGPHPELEKAIKYVADDVIPTINTAMGYDQTYERQISSPIDRALKADTTGITNDTALIKQLEEWKRSLEGVVRYVSGANAKLALQNLFHYELSDDQKLQDLAIRVLLDSVGVTCVLLGMRKVRYVKAALKLLKSTQESTITH